MREKLKIEVIGSGTLSGEDRAEIISLCNRAYERDLEQLFDTFRDATHIVARIDGALVSHAMWVTRWLQCSDMHPLRTAYVEMVATEPKYWGRGFASAVMERLATEITDYELGALCPTEPGIYAKLGWEFWRGPLFIRSSEGLLPTPNERIMILRLPNTPVLDLEAPLSAEWREGELW